MLSLEQTTASYNNLSRFIINDINFLSSLINPNFPVFFKIDLKENKIEIINHAYIILDQRVFKIFSVVEEKFCLNGKVLLKYLNILKKNSIKMVDVQFSLDSVVIHHSGNKFEIKIEIPIFDGGRKSNQSLFHDNEIPLTNFFRVILSKYDLEKISKFLIQKSHKHSEKICFDAEDNKLYIKSAFQGHKRSILLTKAEFLEYNELNYLISDKFFRTSQMDFISKILLSFNEKFLSFEILFNDFDETYFEWREMRFLE